MPFDRKITQPSKTSLVLPGGVIAATAGPDVFIQGGKLDANDAIRLMAFLARVYRNEFGADPRTEKPSRKVGGRA